MPSLSEAPGALRREQRAPAAQETHSQQHAFHHLQLVFISRIQRNMAFIGQVITLVVYFVTVLF